MDYLLLGRSGLRVSELCLGTMTFGKEWGWGADEAESRAMFEVFAEAGGNFIDTANRYTEGTSERMVGELIANDRDHFVLATKFTLHDRRNDVSYSGNNRRNMMRSVEESLRRLRTTHIDLLWLHAWDSTTPEDEVMRGLDDLVRSGKVHYIGVSDTPAWIVARCNTMAELRGWSQFVGLQVEYSLVQRTPERELLPMAASMGLGITPWAPLGAGLLTGKYLKGEAGRLANNSKKLTERNIGIAQAVAEVAAEMGATSAQVALRWLMDRGTVPIIGGSRAAQIIDNLGAVGISLSSEQTARLDAVSAIEMGFPHDFLNSDGVRDVIFGGMQGRIRR
jgi:aryl-alcohol dehydrogenase-like predicted oxidoreductase